MRKIKIEKPTTDQITAMTREPTWSAGASAFDWEYDSMETCYIVKGDIRVTTPEGEVVDIGPGDLVTFPQGLRCRWEIRAPVLKHYRLG